MKIHVLGCGGAELPNLRMPAFLIDETILLDAGTIGMALEINDQVKIKDIFVSHAHLDHIKALPFFADNIVTRNIDHRATIHGTEEIIDILKNHLFNGLVWPDFNQIPHSTTPVLEYRTESLRVPVEMDGHRVTAIPVNHPTPAVGFLVEDKNGRRIVYSGDTGPTNELWTIFDEHMDALIVELSFPNEMEERALISGHLTPALFERELEKMKVLPERILITHTKPNYTESIREQIGNMGEGRIEFLKDGQIITI